MLLSDPIIPLFITFLAGLSTIWGGLFAVLIKKLNKNILAFSLGLSAGVMIYISFANLLSNAIKNAGFINANIPFFIGLIVMFLIDKFTPYHQKLNLIFLNRNKGRLFRLGVVTAVALAIHNLPEGLSVFLSAYTNLKLGFPLFFAITLHNITEGIAIAIPIYFATKNKFITFLITGLSGMTEPLGALLCYFIFGSFITNSTLHIISAFTAGIMVYVSFDELLPASMEYHKGHLSILGVICGMLFASISLSLF